MLENIISNIGNVSFSNMVLYITVSIVLGIIISVVHMFTTKYTKNFVITVALLPLLVQMIIFMVDGNLGTSVAVLGAFSLVRFRSIPGNSREITTIFFAMVVGLAIGIGQILFACVLVVLVSLLLIILSKSRFGNGKNERKKLKIVIPENLNYTDVFNDVLSKYTSFFNLEKVKTTNLGTMFELTYDIDFDKSMNEKEFIDEIRKRNGNLTVAIYLDKADYMQL